MFRRVLRNQSGATAIEYSLIAAMIALVIVGAVGAVGTNLTPIFQSVSAGFTN